MGIIGDIKQNVKMKRMQDNKKEMVMRKKDRMMD